MYQYQQINLPKVAHQYHNSSKSLVGYCCRSEELHVSGHLKYGDAAKAEVVNIAKPLQVYWCVYYTG